MKAMESEIKENIQGTNSDGKETGTQIIGMDQKEERNIQPENNEEPGIQKTEERLRNFQGNLEMLQYPNYIGTRRTRGRAKY